MVTSLSHSTTPTLVHSLFSTPPLLSLSPLSGFRPHPTNLSVTSLRTNNTTSLNALNPDPRTLFPGGYKRPEIKVPNLVLQLTPDEVLDDNRIGLDAVDVAVSGRVGIVVLDGGVGTGGRLYEAACLLKSVIRDRAYFMVSERVDIAAAVNASGVVLSDQGLPAIVARNTMIDARSESVVLPLVAKNVQTPVAALNASNSEGADFLIYGSNGGTHAEEPGSSVWETVKVPIFVMIASFGFDPISVEAKNLLKSGASGLVVSLGELKVLTDEVMSKLFTTVRGSKNRGQGTFRGSDKLKTLKVDNGFPGRKKVAGFIKLEDRERQLVETEKMVLLEVISVIQGAVPLMKEVSLLIDAVSQLDEPFLLVIVGEFNSGKSTVINALLGEKYLKDGVVPTTNEITFLRYSELESSEQQRCERHPDGQLICYLPASILKEVAFLRYTQQWKKKVMFVLNKSDIFRNPNELEEAVAFVKENTQKLLNTEHVTLYPVSARLALEAKLSASYKTQKESGKLSITEPLWRTSSFDELEKFLYSFLDGSTNTGIERMKLKLETPIGIAEQLLCACQKIVSEKCQHAKQDFMAVNEVVDSVKEYAMKMESSGISWKRQTLSLIDSAQARIIKVIESTLQLSNLDRVASYAFKEKAAPMAATSSVQNDIIGPALSDAQKLLREYMTWLQSTNAREGKLYMESFEKRWPSLVDRQKLVQLHTRDFLAGNYEQSVKVIENFSAAAASKLFEQEIREIFLGTFGGLGAAGLSASLLTSVLPTTIEDLLALGLCSVGGFVAISNFPARRQRAIDKVKRTADALALEMEEAMQKDLFEATQNLENFVKLIGKPYQDSAQSRLDGLLKMQENLTDVEKKLETLQIEIQNLHISQ
ncbi:probable transmembrane GTPase FZO-like, chloroplastic isoform X2 [Rhododendron vialii]|uniref:probable transmembrane GTPase FZO-like, chloroplastic isoform X2 n=1 Tax=Rhododendron vialii TaxID=182163 RepID=UPI00265EACEB|nr:probable transmembrane GTPase FZO-like, chloroplastic isoform X2 [Rhododendron vialii]